MRQDLDRNARAAIMRAEAAIEALAPSFRSWLAEEVRALGEAYQGAAEEDFSQASRQGMFLSAHTLKGQAATLGYPQISQLAASLCRLLDFWHQDELFETLAFEHVKAIETESLRAPDEAQDAAAQQLVRYLSTRTAQLVGEPVGL